MKFLRVFGNILVGIILFGLIFSLSFITETKNFLEKSIIEGSIKNAIEESSKEDVDLNDSQKKLVDEIFGDSEISSILNMVIDNYREFRTNSNYHVSKNDADKLYSFVKKYKNRIEDLSGEDVSKMSDDEFEKFFDYEKINQFANDSFKKLDEKIDKADMNQILDVYNIATSNTVKYAFILLIAVFIIILGLINCSVYKWLIPTGIVTIISGILMVVIFITGSMFTNIFDIENMKIAINLNRYLIVGIIEIILGIVMIIAESIIVSKINKKVITNTNQNKEMTN